MHQTLPFDQIRDRAAALGLPLSELARQAQVARSTLERLLTGRTPDPHLRTVERVVAVLAAREAAMRAHLRALERSAEGRQLDLVTAINGGNAA